MPRRRRLPLTRKGGGVRLEQANAFDFRGLPSLRCDGRDQQTKGEGHDQCYGAEPHVGLPNKNFYSQIPPRGHWHLDDRFGLMERIFGVSGMQANVGE
jgi:hypothetical protein